MKTIEEVIRLYLRGILTAEEICQPAWARLHGLPVDARLVELGQLAASGFEEVRAVADTIVTLFRHEALSLDLEFIRRHSPLGPGTRIDVSGGLDDFEWDGRPSGFAGSGRRPATFLRFAPRHPGHIPVALIEFDDPVSQSTGGGRYGVLMNSFSADAPAWMAPTPTVAVHLVESLPDDHTLLDDFLPWQVAHARLFTIGGPARFAERWDTRVRRPTDDLTIEAALHAVLKSADGTTWWNAAARLLNERDAVAIENLCRLLRDTTRDDRERAEAATLLGQLVGRADVVDALASRLDSGESEEVRKAAGLAFARGLENTGAFEEWLNRSSSLLDDADGAARAMRQLTEGLPETRDLLVRAVALLDEAIGGRLYRAPNLIELRAAASEALSRDAH